VFVLQDEEYGPAKIWQIIDEEEKVCLAEWGEVNMGDPKTLHDFLVFVKDDYPTDRYILALYDHGMAWAGACVDKTSGDDFLWMPEIELALRVAGGVDLALFTAPCLMGAVESAYELRDCTDVYIGSEDLSGFMWWFDTIRDFLGVIEDNPDIGNMELGEVIIEHIYENRDRWNESPSYEQLTMSAVRTDRLVELAASIDALSVSYLSNIDILRSLTGDLFDATITRFSDGVDLYHFADYLEQNDDDLERSRLSGDVKTSLEACIIAECHGSDYPHAHGLTIYFPVEIYNTIYATCLDLSEDTQWDDLLDLYHGTEKAMRLQPSYPKGSGLFVREN
jgi:hypothetical protein